jgi:hypothetical protein
MSVLHLRIIRHALKLTADMGGKFAALLPHAYDTAIGRIDLNNTKLPVLQVERIPAAHSSVR